MNERQALALSTVLDWSWRRSVRGTKCAEETRELVIEEGPDYATGSKEGTASVDSSMLDARRIWPKMERC